MDETPFSSYSDELSAEDLAIIQAFDEMTDLSNVGNLDEQQKATSESSYLLNTGASSVESADDMLMLFASEAEEDVATMRRALLELEQDNHANSSGLVTLGRAAHKLKGTSGAMGCEMMSKIAWHVEEEIQFLKDGKITVLTCLSALVHALKAIEMTLQSVVDDGQESQLPLQQLLLDLNDLNTADEQSLSSTDKHKAVASEPLEPLLTLPPTPFDLKNLHTLMSHTEHLIELNTPLQSIQKQISKSLVELQAAHGRLHYLEGVISTVAFPGLVGNEQNSHAGENSGSSLVARILQLTNRQPPARPRAPSAHLNSAWTRLPNRRCGMKWKWIVSRSIRS